MPPTRPSSADTPGRRHPPGWLPKPRPARGPWLALACAASLALAGCAAQAPQPPAGASGTSGASGVGTAEPAPAPPPPPIPGSSPEATATPGASGTVLGRQARLLVYRPRPGDTLAGIATRFLSTADQAWQIAEANGDQWTPVPGQPLVVPLVNHNPLGIAADSLQTVPVLCYHRLGTPVSKMVVAPARFEAQLAWLAENHYQVQRLGDVASFLAGKRALPQRSVVITFDDGYESVYRHAFPLLKQYGVPATLFVYTDFIGARDALSWAQLQEMAASGLVDIQAHSKTHRNLAQAGANESAAEHTRRVEAELRQPRSLLQQKLAGVQVKHFAYPYGSANEPVLQAMQRQAYELGLSVVAGGNPFYANPLLLKRSMVFGDLSLDDFKTKLQTQRGFDR